MTRVTHPTWRPVAATLLAVVLLAGCATRTPWPAGSTTAGPSVAVADTAHAATPAPAAAAAPVRTGYSEADVRFMQRMIGHHAQALAMTALVPSRAVTRDVRAIAQRIEQSQRDEIARMRQWLVARHEAVPDADRGGDMAHQMAAMGQDMSGMSSVPMPGMLSSDQLAALGRASGAAFDRLFLEDMIRHHEGAITMVGTLLGTPGAAQEPEIFGLASEVDSGQRAEIARMRTTLRAMGGQ